jgi:protocatechuate 3,4-dioxygenase beta subunit
MRSAILCVAVLARLLTGQEASPAKENSKASLEGTVVKEPAAEPLKKAIIELIGEDQQVGGNYTATSDQDGRFAIRDIQPGRYKLFVERTGFIEVDAKRRHSPGALLSFAAGEQVKDRNLHMLPAAILTGRVVDEDGDPMANVEITVLRRRSTSFEPSGSAQTNDLGEYRIGGLMSGKYYVAASPLPNFQSMVPVLKGTDDKATPSSNASYLTTYYPGVLDRAQATPVELNAGEEMPVDFSLTRRHAASVKGRISGLASGSQAMVMLRGKDANTVFSAGQIDQDGRFEIRNVAPGSYILMAMTVIAENPQIVRQPIDVGSADLEDVQLALVPPATIRGRVHFSGKAPKQEFMVFLHEMNGNDDFSGGVAFSGDEATLSSTLAKVKPDGSFELKNVPAGLYELAVSADSGGLNDTFVESLIVGTKDFVDRGLNVNGGMLSVDLTLSSGAGVIDGVVVSEKNKPVADSVVIAVPESRFRKQLSRYQRAPADQLGHFTLRGLRPGTYTLYAWEALEGDEYMDPEFLKDSETLGKIVRVEKASHQSLELKVIPAAEQP